MLIIPFSLPFSPLPVAPGILRSSLSDHVFRDAPSARNTDWVLLVDFMVNERAAEKNGGTGQRLN
ncbi:hypothetical protein HDU93_004578, partial [Gonapodya sp. JEL0774]